MALQTTASITSTLDRGNPPAQLDSRNAVLTVVERHVSRSSATWASLARTPSKASAPRIRRRGGSAARVTETIALAASAGSPGWHPSRASAVARVFPLVDAYA